VSDRVTWERCPRCRGRAAVGWAVVPRSPGQPAAEVPVEFDCAAGCSVSWGALLRLIPPPDGARTDDDRSAVDRPADL
jgi:hypothetical protein